MISSNVEFLKNELYDVVKLFGESPDVTHTMEYADGVFRNAFTIDGEASVFTDGWTYTDELEFKRYAKRFSKLALYALLKKKYARTMPWGALTGIRPTKLAYAEAEAGRPFEPLFERMGVAKENIALIGRVLEGQRGIYEKNKGGSDLFVGIPFCPSKCAYCSFITADIRYTEKYLDEYIAVLRRELDGLRPFLHDVKSVYVGGGTPFVLSEERLERVYRAIADLSLSDVEYTVEAGRPDVFTEEKLRLTKEFGVSRLCINTQTFLDRTLEAIGRRHTARQVYEAFDMAAKYRFVTNLDLIAGLEGESVEDFVYSLRQAIACDPDNITVHTLCLKKGAKLKEEQSFLDGSKIGGMIEASRELLSLAGYEPYYLYRQKYMAGNFENVGWTKKGKACVYNVDIMEEITDNPAVGANAISKKVFTGGRIERYASPKDIPTYLAKIDEIIEKKSELFASI
ncbi:MAG: coproporphyrinogen dehydrogenase HemZ [Christensenellaceae bacterium]